MPHEQAGCRASRHLVRASRHLVRTSRQPVRASRQLVRASRQLVRTSRQAVRASRQLVRASRQAVRASRQLVRASRQAVRASGQLVRASRQAVRTSRQLVRASRQVVRASRQAVCTSRQVVRTSRQAVRTSRQVVRASRQAVRTSRQVVRASRTFGCAGRQAACLNRLARRTRTRGEGGSYLSPFPRSLLRGSAPPRETRSSPICIAGRRFRCISALTCIENRHLLSMSAGGHPDYINVPPLLDPRRRRNARGRRMSHPVGGFFAPTRPRRRGEVRSLPARGRDGCPRHLDSRESGGKAREGAPHKTAPRSARGYASRR